MSGAVSAKGLNRSLNADPITRIISQHQTACPAPAAGRKLPVYAAAGLLVDRAVDPPTSADARRSPPCPVLCG